MGVKVIGLGPGALEYILPKATLEMESSHIILGFKRAIESLNHIKTPKKVIYTLQEVLDYIKENPDKEIAVVASGDPGFYGILDYLKKNIKKSIKVIPGISSFQYLMSKLEKSWQGAYIGSLHGREADFEEIIKAHKLSVWLTDKVQNPSYICDKLSKQKEEYWVYVGENLSYPDERITKGRPEDLQNKSWGGLCVVVIQQKVSDQNEIY